MGNSATCTLREARGEDAEEICALYRRVAEVLGGLARLPFEITRPYVDNFLTLSALRGVGFVAETAQGKVVGEIHASSPEIFCFSHVLSDLTMAVDPLRQGRGVGRQLFDKLLESVSTLMPHISRIELIARESNERAIVFYESLGFVKEGEFKGRVLNADGSLESDIPMALHLTKPAA